jgi:hypothetical protein
MVLLLGPLCVHRDKVVAEYALKQMAQKEGNT